MFTFSLDHRFGGIDILINNASAISLTPTLSTTAAKFDLMFDINVRGTFTVSRLALPHLLRSQNPHILTMSPPLLLVPAWFAPFPAYAMSKYAMSLSVLALAEEFRDRVRRISQGETSINEENIFLSFSFSFLIGRGGQCSLA